MATPTAPSDKTLNDLERSKSRLLSFWVIGNLSLMHIYAGTVMLHTIINWQREFTLSQRSFLFLVLIASFIFLSSNRRGSTLDAWIYRVYWYTVQIANCNLNIRYKYPFYKKTRARGIVQSLAQMRALDQWYILDKCIFFLVLSLILPTKSP